MKEHLITGIDIGSSTIRLVAGQVVEGAERRPQLTIIGAAECASQGISKGVITSLEDAVSSISQGLELLERQTGIPVHEAYVSIGGSCTSVQLAKGVIGVSRTDSEIRSEDVDRALDAARTSVNPANYEILHVLPRSFTIDGQSGVKDPVGMQGIRLEVEAHVVQGLATHVRNLTKTVFRTNIDISELVYAPLAPVDVVTASRQREVGVAVVNVGASTTSIAIYEDGELLHACVLPLGSDHITQDIAIVLRTSLDVAEKFKMQYVSADASHVNKQEVLNLRDFGGDSSETVSPRFISEIAQARIEEIFHKVEQELARVNRSGLLPAGVVLTGGGVKLHGMVEMAKQSLRLPVTVGVCNGLQSPLTEALQDSAFTTAIGLVQWGFARERSDDHGRKISFASGGRGGDMMKNAGSIVKKIFGSFLP